MARFKDPVEHRRADAGTPPGRFAGLPVGVQLETDWVYHFLRPLNSFNDLFDETNDWTATETGAGGTRVYSDDLFPPHLIITCDALDNDSVEMQFTSANGVGEYVSFADDTPVYFETMIRLRDANNNQATVEQVDWFVGIAVTDTTVLDGATDFVGFSKVDQDSDATNRIAFVCGDAGGAAGLLRDQLVQATGWTSNNPTGTQATDRGAKVLGPNQWIKLAFLVHPNNAGASGAGYVWVNDEPMNSLPLSLDGFLPNENICLTLCIQNGEAVAKIMDVAYVLCAKKLYDDFGVMV